MRLLVVVLREFAEPEAVGIVVGIDRRVLVDVVDQSIRLQFEQHRQQQGCRVLHLVLEADQLLEHWHCSYSGNVVEDHQLFGTEVEHSV